MALLSLLFVLVQSLIQYPQPAGDGLDEASHRRMQERQELLEREMARLLQELEQGAPEQQDEGWGALFFGALQQWPFWLLAGLLLLLGLWFSCRRRSWEANSSGKDQSSCKMLGDERGKGMEEDSVNLEEDEENMDVTVKTDDSSIGNEGDGSPVAANEGDDDANEGNNDRKEDSDVKSEDGRDAEKDEGWSDGNVPGEKTAEGNEEEPGNAAGNTEGQDEINEGGNKDVQVEEYKDTGKEEEDGNEDKTNVNMNAGNDDGNKGENNVGGKEEDADVQVEEDKDTGKEEEDGNEKKKNGSNMKAGKKDDVNEGGDNVGGKEEDADVQVEPDKGTGMEEDGNEERNNANMKAGNNYDVNEGEDNGDGKEEYADVKGQESSDVSEQSSRDWTGQEDNSAPGNEADQSGFTGTEEEIKEAIKEDDNDRNKDVEQGDVNVKGSQNEDGKEDEQGNMAAGEKEGSDGGKEESSNGGIEDEEDAQDVGNEQGILLLDRIQWPVEEVERGCSVIAELMESFAPVFADSVSNSFYPVPQEAIGVGSAFEGWSPHEWDGVYRVLIPLNPPPGHAFHLELNRAEQTAARTFCVRVELVCTCEREQVGEKLLCFLHDSKKELRQKQKRSLLETLCTGSYLDVEKTSHWFYQLVRSSWLHVPQSYSWHLVFQPCSRSCRFQLSKGKESLVVEMLFGVCQGDSDIFVVSQLPEAQKGSSSICVSGRSANADFIASTAWPETYAVAEARFLWYIGWQLPCEGLHLKCLQVFTCILRGTGFSSSTWKTLVMHVLTTVPLSRWRRRDFARRLWDIMAHLRRCLQLKRLEHFVLGNKRLPAEISLPPAMREVEPLNFFEHLAQDPAAHREAMQAYGQLRFRLWMLLSSH